MQQQMQWVWISASAADDDVTSTQACVVRIGATCCTAASFGCLTACMMTYGLFC